MNGLDPSRPVRRTPTFRFGFVGCFALLFLMVIAASSARGPQVEIVAPGGRAITTVHVEIASTPAEQEHGLMFRRHLAANAGMIFVFPASAHLEFWMKNTEIPLDMIFADDRRDIVGIVREARPLSTNSLGVKAPSRYVLEVNGGFCDRHGITAGDRLRFIGF